MDESCFLDNTNLDNTNLNNTNLDNTNLNNTTLDNTTLDNTNYVNTSFDFANYEEQKSRKRSLVWNFFEKVGLKRVRCRVCSHEQNYQGTTGNILRHLKARHDLDVTLKGQQDPRNRKRIKEYSSMTLPIKTEVNIDRKPVLPIRKLSMSSESSDTVDPYSGTKQEKFESGNMFYETIPELEEDCLEESINYKIQERKSSKRTKLEEDRILAETEYFREKAAYFRIQKHFTALQAKKVKLEIEQINLNNKNAT
ncbi:uncharacterized protein LOC135954563 [Calliphora vicina]|uniref:uncharacterized protein LOC135954563 n=1 Tax=Calliphora vicina TaxID=7373 RepID=UPI00325AA12A